jgi:hypothetical protein
MADKLSLLIKYSYLDAANKAKLSDADFGLLMRSIIIYDRTGREPKLKNANLSMAFELIKKDLDNNKKKWEDRVIANQNNGKKGGRPKTQKPKKPSGLLENPEKPMGFLNNPTKPKKPDSGYVSGSDNDLDNDPNKKNLNNSGGGGMSQPPPQLFKQIKKESRAQGFFIDTNFAITILDNVHNPTWFNGPNSFLEYCAFAVRKKYPKKDNDELNPLFVSATGWENLQESYPQWKVEQDKKAAEKKKEEAIEAARKNRPKCKCGGTLKEFGPDEFYCEECRNIYFFDEKQLKWILRE